MLNKFTISPRVLKTFMNLWPPFLGAGISICEISEDWRYARVRLRRGLLNRNMFGTHFGGSLFAMTDAMYAILLARCLDNKYYVWDKKANIEFLLPGKTDVYADFRVETRHIEQIEGSTANHLKCEPVFNVHVTDKGHNLVAQVEKTLYVKLKPQYRDKKAQFEAA